MASAVEGLAWEKEAVGAYLFSVSQRVLDLEVEVRELEGAKSSLEA